MKILRFAQEIDHSAQRFYEEMARRSDNPGVVRIFRDGLGFITQGIVGGEFEHGAVVFFDLEGGLRLALWPRHSLAYDTGLPDEPSSAIEFTLGHNISSPAEVDAVMDQAEKAGAIILKRRPGIPSGEALPGISRTLTSICGKSHGTPCGQ